MPAKMTKKDGSKMPVLAICIGILENNTQVNRMRSLCIEMEKAGYTVMVFSTFRDIQGDDVWAKGERSIYSLINYEMLDGVIVCPESIKCKEIIDDMQRNCYEQGIPMISLGTQIEGAYSVLSYSGKAIYELIMHVIDVHNCKKINMISGIKGNSYSEDRVQSYRQALEERGIPVEEDRIGYGGFWSVPTEEVMETFLAGDKPLPDAIICANDAMALAAAHYLQNRGYKVPEDVIVTGYDGMDTAEYYSPKITTAKRDDEAVAVKIVEILKMIEKGEKPEDVYRIPCGMVLSESCGCVPKNENEQNQSIMSLLDRRNYEQGYREYMDQLCDRITTCRKLSDAVNILRENASEKSFLILNHRFFEKRYREDEDSDKVYSERLRVAIARDEKECFTTPDITPDQILPNLEYYLQKEGRLFLPLFFQDEVIGYHCSGKMEDLRDYVNLDYKLRRLSQSLVIVRNVERMNYLYTRDHLTGIYNRRGFYQTLKELLSEAKPVEDNLVMISIDLDGLKMINDTYGHNEGDNAIWQAAYALRIAGRKEGFICSRFGGDEYVVALISKGDPEEDGKNFIGKFEKALRTYNSISEKPYQVKGSCGYAIVPIEEQMNIDQILSSADSMMYEVKASHHRRESGRE